MDSRELYSMVISELKDMKTRIAANKLFLLALKGERSVKQKLRERQGKRVHVRKDA